MATLPTIPRFRFRQQIDQEAALAAMFARRRSRTVWALGDSLTAGSGSGGGGITYDNTLFASTGQPCLQYQGGSWTTWALFASDARWTFGGVFATASWTAAQILATHVPAVIAAAAPGDTVVVLAGTNGNVLADVKKIHAALRDAGLHTVACTIPPSSASTLASVAAFNAGIKKYAASNGIPLVDLHGAVVDPATGAYSAAYNGGDGIHPNQAGSKVMGEAIATVVNTFFANRVALVDHNAAFAGQLQTKPLGLGAPAAGTDYNFLSAAGTSTVTFPGKAGWAGGGSYLWTRGDTNISGRLANITLVAGRRIRLGMALNAAGAARSWGMRLESSTTGQKVLFGIGYPTTLTTVLGDSRFFVEFTVPTLPDYSYRLRVAVEGAGTTLQQGELTIQDLTAMGAV